MFGKREENPGEPIWWQRLSGCAKIVWEGIGHAEVHAVSDDTAEIVDLYIEPDKRNRSYGRELLQNIINDLRKAGFKKVTLHVDVRSGAVGMYSTEGFREVAAEYHMELKL